MPIVIKELIASDTISQAVDKINFNFDQLLLNGGGPAGPKGLKGDRGPIGGRGERGSKWYEDITTSPGTDPNSLIFSDLNEDDNYLQSDGSVWTWNGTSWSLSPVNLTGPIGPPGISAGFSYFGSNVPSLPRFKQSIYPSVFGPGDGANTSNEGIPTAVFGASISNDTLYPGSPGLSELSNSLASSINSSLVSTLIHVKSTAAKSIMFSGGDQGSYYEQNNLSNLSNITLLSDDTLAINVPKIPDNPFGDLIGFRVITDTRGQQYRSGKSIQFITGTDPGSYQSAVPDISDFIVNVNGYPSLSSGPRISLNVLYSPNTATINIGNVTIPTATSKTGSIVLDAKNIRSISTDTNIMIGGGSSTNSFIEVGNGIIGITSGDIILASNNGSDIDISSSSGSITLSTPIGGLTVDAAGGVGIRSTNGSILLFKNTSSGSAGINITGTGSSGDGVLMKGNIAWNSSGYSQPFTSSHKHIYINGNNISANTNANLPNSPIIISPNDIIGTGTTQWGGDAILINTPNNISSSTKTTIRAYGININAGDTNDISYDNPREGLIIRGKDEYNSSSADDKINFHAKRNATEISNRAVFSAKTITYDPLINGTSNIVLLNSDIDTTFLDIQISHTTIINPTPPSPWSNNVIIDIPDGLYHGQKLIIRIIAAPSRLGSFVWPQGGGSVANAIISLRAKTSGLTGPFPSSSTGKEIFETATVTGWGYTPASDAGGAGELYAELIWLGKEIDTVNGTTGSGVIYKYNRGWNVCSSYGITRKPTSSQTYATSP